jgi:chemotaxis protein methyltransferase CheR
MDTAVDREFHFHARDFARVRTLIYDRAGISLHEGKQAMVYSRLSRRLRETGHPSFENYLQWLESASGAQAQQEWQEFVNCLTTNLTSFFREEHHFHALTEWLKARGSQPTRIWCCAASTGEEPYSLAITVAETLGLNAPVKILASDIDTNVLQTAAQAVYDVNARGLNPQRLKQFFKPGEASFFFYDAHFKQRCGEGAARRVLRARRRPADHDHAGLVHRRLPVGPRGRSAA